MPRKSRPEYGGDPAEPVTELDEETTEPEAEPEAAPDRSAMAGRENTGE